MALSLCHHCGLVFNTRFDPTLVTYDAAYENSLHYSPRFEEYAASLAADLAGRFDLRERLVVEVGCGKGDFLRSLCQVSGARGLGIDASYDPAAATTVADDRVTFVREPFSSLPANLNPVLVLCRHVIEHLPEPEPFVAELTAAAGRTAGCRVFLEVPNVLYTLRDLGIWDIIYEHCSYFSAPALWRLCERAGLGVERAYATFGEQYLCLEGVGPRRSVSPDFSADIAELVALTTRFGAAYQAKVDHWRTRLSDLQRAGRSAAIWGAGSKGITFVNTVPGGDAITCLVDLNPRKQGRFAPGVGQPVVAPEDLTVIKPDVIVVMNPLYRDEIAERAKGLGLTCDVEVA